VAKVILKFDDRILDECVIGHPGVSIGRLPDNQIVIDNPAVSGHHARVFMDGDKTVLEDLKSTNGTFINNKPVVRRVLEHGDVVLIGKHTITFDGLSLDVATEPREAVPVVPDLGGTRMLETQRHKAMVAKWEREARADKAAEEAAGKARTDLAAALPKTATLHVLSGRTNQTEYNLSAHTSLIGKSDTALVRLRGWFKPKAAAAIARKDDIYTVTPLAGKATVNGVPLTGRTDLKDGDVLQVSGVTLEFRLK
jgi:pSer/pThr/pTyr-binding forkhead associated (FHA) protein